MQSRHLKTIASLILLISLGISWLTYNWYQFLKTPLLSANQSIVYILKPGSSIRTLANDLYQIGLLKKPNYLICLSYFNGANKKLKAGEYQFDSGITPSQLLSQIVAGKVVLHEITFIEGWNFSKVLEALNDNLYLQHTVKGLSLDQIMTKLGYAGQHPEGQFFPDTYRFTLDTSDTAILLKAFKAMQIHLNIEWQNRAPILLYQKPYDALIVASMIEKEAAKAEERPIIAGILLRRIQKNMLLQIDPTVIYGMGERYTGKITKSDLHADTLYNTYVHHGLPPTPISLPGLSSLRAALHPAKGDSLYFVAKGDGSHYFSATLSEHNKAVTTYQLKPKNENSHAKHKK